MNFDFIRRIFCLNINYRIVSNEFARLCSVVSICFYIICRFVGKHIIILAELSYNKFNFTQTRVSRVIHIHRFVSYSRKIETPTKAELTRLFSFVQNSQKIYSYGG